MLDEETQALARQAGLDVMHPPAELRERLGSKIIMTRLANEAGVPACPTRSGGSAPTTSFWRWHTRRPGRRPRRRAAYGNAGSATFFVHGQRDWDHHAGDLTAQKKSKS